MTFENWSKQRVDVSRIRRLVLGGSVGALTVAAGMAYLVLTSSAVAEEIEEEEETAVEVQLQPALEPEPPPPPPEPAPPPAAQPPRPDPRPRLRALQTPSTLSDEQLVEKEAKPAVDGGDPYEQGSGDGGSSAPEPAVVAPAAPPPPPPAPVLPQPKRPVPVSEGMTPPEPLVALVKPEYPADAKAAGLEGTVVVRYVVNEQGDVTDVRALKGPTQLHQVCVAAVKALRFKPALDADGKPVSVVRYMKFPFKLRT